MARRPSAVRTERPSTVVRDERPGPAEFADPRLSHEVQRAAVWLGMALLIVGVVVLAQPLLLIIGGLVFSVILDGGARLLGRVLPIRRGFRLALVVLAGLAFVGWVFYYAGTTLAAQAEALREVVTVQFNQLMALANEFGLIPSGTRANLTSQVLGGVGRLTTAVSSALGVVTAMLAVIVIGIFIAIEPRLYDRGVAWMLPVRHRVGFYTISDRVGFTLRRLLAGRLLGMVIEGVATWLLLAIYGVPMSALLGLLTGLLAFLPNIGAPISGALMVLVGFSGGADMGIYCFVVYVVVQTVDGNIIVPMVAKKTVDLAPALVLAAQLLFGTLFGILGLLLADPIVAAIKVALEQISSQGETKRSALVAAAKI